ncbi:MAG: hypothetical protein ACPG5B_06675 [Chitinophagales bacterium]
MSKYDFLSKEYLALPNRKFARFYLTQSYVPTENDIVEINGNFRIVKASKVIKLDKRSNNAGFIHFPKKIDYLNTNIVPFDKKNSGVWDVVFGLDCSVFWEYYESGNYYCVDIGGHWEVETLTAQIHKLASIQYDIWSHWTQYQLSVGTFDTEGNFVIPKEKIERWHRQSQTRYVDLSAKEKQSNIEQVNKFKDFLNIDLLNLKQKIIDL